MNEEEKLAQPSPEALGPSEPPEAPEEEHASPARRRSVFPYLAILFATAFLLLLFAYLMQQRDSEEIMGNLSDLRQSLGSIQSIDELVAENRQLREEKEALEGKTAQLQEERDGLKTQLEALQGQYDEASGSSAAQEKVVASWLHFWQLEADFLAKDYEACAQFFLSLPADNVPYPEGQGVQERVEEIYAELVERGVLAEGEGWMTPEGGE